MDARRGGPHVRSLACLQADQTDKETLVLKTGPIRARRGPCLRQYSHSPHQEVAETGKGLLKYWERLFTVLEYEGVEPSKDSTEGGIRPGFQWEKNRYCNQSGKGALLSSRLLTVTRTCVLQNRNPMDFSVDSIIAHRSGSNPPQFVPATT